MAAGAGRSFAKGTCPEESKEDKLTEVLDEFKISCYEK